MEKYRYTDPIKAWGERIKLGWIVLPLILAACRADAAQNWMAVPIGMRSPFPMLVDLWQRILGEGFEVVAVRRGNEALVWEGEIEDMRMLAPGFAELESGDTALFGPAGDESMPLKEELQLMFEQGKLNHLDRVRVWQIKDDPFIYAESVRQRQVNGQPMMLIQKYRVDPNTRHWEKQQLDKAGQFEWEPVESR